MVPSCFAWQYAQSTFVALRNMCVACPGVAAVATMLKVKEQFGDTVLPGTVGDTWTPSNLCDEWIGVKCCGSDPSDYQQYGCTLEDFIVFEV